MSSFEVTEKKDKGYLRDVVFCYTKIQSAVFKYSDRVHKEYTVDCIVDEDTAEEFEEMFPKNKVKKIKTEEFEGIFKTPPPFPEEKRQYMIKMKADATYKDGNEVPYEYNTRPKVFIPVEEGVKDITMDVLVANGSKGDVSFRINSNDFGTFPKLTGILVTDLIEYESSGGGSDFGDVVNKEEAEEKASKKASNKAARTTTQEETSEEEISDELDQTWEEDLPF